MWPRPWVRPTAVVVLPSPAFVGVTPATQMILPCGRSARRSSALRLDLGLVAAVRLDLLGQEAERRRDVVDGLEVGFLRDLEVALHRPILFARVGPAASRSAGLPPSNGRDRPCPIGPGGRNGPSPGSWGPTTACSRSSWSASRTASRCRRRAPRRTYRQESQRWGTGRRCRRVYRRPIRAAVTQAIGSVDIRDVPEPAAPGPGEVVVRPDVVGICGSDLHLVEGHLRARGGCAFRASRATRSARLRAVGPGCRAGSTPARRSRSSRCAGAATATRAASGAPTCATELPASSASTSTAACRSCSASPTSRSSRIARVPSGGRARRAGLDRDARRAIADAMPGGERVVVLGAGPIGQSVAPGAAHDRGVEVLLVDPLESPRAQPGARRGDARLERRARGRRTPRASGAAARDPRSCRRDRRSGRGRARESTWSRPAGPRGAGRHVGRRRAASTRQLHREGARRRSASPAAERRRVRRGRRACRAQRRRARPAVSHEFPLDRAPEALRFAMRIRRGDEGRHPRRLSRLTACLRLRDRRRGIGGLRARRAAERGPGRPRGAARGRRRGQRAGDPHRRWPSRRCSSRASTGTCSASPSPASAAGASTSRAAGCSAARARSTR